MIDEAFHLTPNDVRRYAPPRALRGYDPEHVNNFHQQVADEMERLIHLNQDLEGKARGFHEQLRAFRERDKAINEALISAQQLREEIREQADREGELIRREARAEADRVVEEAKSEVRRLQEQVSAAQRLRRTYLAQFRVLAERHLAEIDVEERVTPSADSIGQGNGASSWAQPGV